MKNTILFIAIAFLISCNSNTNSKSKSDSSLTEENTPPKEEIKKPIEPVAKITYEKTDSIFEGMYSYMADANMFVSCDKEIKIPVEMKGEYLNLEKQYLRTVDGGTEVYVKLKGYVKKVSPMEGNKKIDALVLEEILELRKDKKCP